MAKRPLKSAAHSPCAIGGMLELLTRPWTLHILWALSHDGPMRFGVLRRQVEGISSRVLTERLRMLEEKKFVFRHYEPTIPPAVTYGITERMKDIEKVLAQLEGLSRKWQGESGGESSTLSVNLGGRAKRGSKVELTDKSPTSRRLREKWGTRAVPSTSVESNGLT